jgi:hypothetical protein
MNAWTSPTDEKIADWARCANGQLVSDHRVACECPSCRIGELRLFFSRRGVEPRGALWLWCPLCKTSYHSQSLIPRWWTPLPEESIVRSSENPFDLLDRMWDQIARVNPLGGHERK